MHFKKEARLMGLENQVFCRFAEWEEDGEVLPRVKVAPGIVGRTFTFQHVAVASITHIAARPVWSFEGEEEVFWVLLVGKGIV